MSGYPDYKERGRLLGLSKAFVTQALIAGAMFCLVGCSSGESPVEAGGDGGISQTSTGTFIAFVTNFQDFRSWTSFTIEGAPDPVSTHTSGKRTLYINKIPAHGSSEFELGTIIVKDIADSDTQPGQLFVMVKRGGDYNPSGAKNWEWFELKEVDSKYAIIWRGVGPPVGESYGGDPSGGCNSCHVSARSNDYVQSAPLSLSKF